MGAQARRTGNVLVRRKQIYLELHPETAHGGDHGNQYTGGKTAKCRFANLPSFTADTAAKINQTVRSVERAIQRAGWYLPIRYPPDLINNHRPLAAMLAAFSYIKDRCKIVPIF